LSLVAFVVVAVLIDRELRAYHLRDILLALRSLPAGAVALCLVATALSYGSLVFYDVLALRYVGKPLPLARTATTSFIAYTFAHNFSLAALTGAGVRYRLYSPAGLTAVDVARVTAFTSVTTALGIGLLGGLALVLAPTAVGEALRLSPGWALGIGLVILAGIAGYAGWATLSRRPVDFFSWRVDPPGSRLVLPQLLAAIGDLSLSALALWVLLPASASGSFAAFSGVYAAALLLGLLSHVPGGLGVFESVVLLAIGRGEPTAVAGALVAYRAIYYLLPLLLGALLLAGHEVLAQGKRVFRAVALVQYVAPQLIGALVFLAGVVLLVSGVTPGVDRRLALLSEVIPLPLVESSHLVGSTVGLALLFLARALFQRVNAAYHLTLILLCAGIAASLLKGLDYEEAALLGVVMGILWLGRGQFYRVASLWEERFSPGWIVNLLIVIGTATWIGFLAQRHVPYSTELWWTFAVDGDAPRMIRASLVVALLTGGAVLGNLLRPAQPEPSLPTAADLARVRQILATGAPALANVALAGDKHLLFAATGDAFLMYRIAGRSWVALGDPVGPRARHEELLWRFRELADEHGGRTVFYGVGGDSLPAYVDLGLTFIKIGEEARVPLAGFSLEGSARGELRTARRRAVRDGATFELVPAERVADMIPALRLISDQWLEEKATHEKGFSLGAFSPEYLANFPVALVRVGGVPVAFANLWLTPFREELSVDLMRFGIDAPKGAMDYLFTELMLWGRDAGYRYFSLGVAPLSGLEQHPLAPAWHRVGNLVFSLGEHFYNFEGLRRYKSKFLPEWQPRYLASPGGLALPRVLMDVSSLISGGLRGILGK
jgi:phosphatidylglycerol lysyltransferase